MLTPEYTKNSDALPVSVKDAHARRIKEDNRIYGTMVAEDILKDFISYLVPTEMVFTVMNYHLGKYNNHVPNDEHKKFKKLLNEYIKTEDFFTRIKIPSKTLCLLSPIQYKSAMRGYIAWLPKQYVKIIRKDYKAFLKSDEYHNILYPPIVLTQCPIKQHNDRLEHLSNEWDKKQKAQHEMNKDKKPAEGNGLLISTMIVAVFGALLLSTAGCTPAKQVDFNQPIKNNNNTNNPRQLSVIEKEPEIVLPTENNQSITAEMIAEGLIVDYSKLVYDIPVEIPVVNNYGVEPITDKEYMIRRPGTDNTVYIPLLKDNFKFYRVFDSPDSWYHWAMVEVTYHPLNNNTGKATYDGTLWITGVDVYRTPNSDGSFKGSGTRYTEMERPVSFDVDYDAGTITYHKNNLNLFPKLDANQIRCNLSDNKCVDTSGFERQGLRFDGKFDGEGTITGEVNISGYKAPIDGIIGQDRMFGSFYNSEHIYQGGFVADKE